MGVRRIGASRPRTSHPETRPASALGGGIDEASFASRLARSGKALIAAALAGLLLAATASAAQATPPGHFRATPTTYIFPAGLMCTFNLQIAEGPNKEVAHVFSDGRVSLTGSYKVTLTNLDTGATLGVNASGPIFTSATGATREAGPQLFGLLPGDVYAQAGGGVVEAYPQDTLGKKVSASFLYNGTRSLFEQAGSSYDRPKGMNHCVMCKAVSRG